jgi:radical SAM enzyme (TIGR04100 family)
MTITYKVKNGIYVNMTNRCPCACTFCLRQNGPGVYGSDSLWLEHEPTVEEVIASIDTWDLSLYDEVVFCGYGEPTERLPELLAVAEYIRSKSDIKIRINTNGLADLIWGRPTAPDLKGVVDAVSVSMNEADAQKYYDLCHPKFGLKSYDAVIKYIEDVRDYVPYVATSVVTSAISSESINICRAKAAELGVVFKLR